MQMVRIFVMFVGIAIVVAGLYLLVLGLGVPIEISSIELGVFKASLTGIGAGAAVVLAGGVVLWLPMQYMKRTMKHTVRTVEEKGDGGKTTTTVIFEQQVQEQQQQQE